MSEERNCYIHNVPTRLSCSSCGKAICTKCMVPAAVGYKCKDCGHRNITHIEKITLPQYGLAFVVGAAVATLTGFIWNYLSVYGFIISAVVAYAVGFTISKSISKVIGNKIGFKIQLLTAILTILALVYNPVLMYLYISGGNPIISSLINFTVFKLNCIKNLISVAIALWASIRHFKI